MSAPRSATTQRVPAGGLRTARRLRTHRADSRGRCWRGREPPCGWVFLASGTGWRTRYCWSGRPSSGRADPLAAGSGGGLGGHQRVQPHALTGGLARSGGAKAALGGFGPTQLRRVLDQQVDAGGLPTAGPPAGSWQTALLAYACPWPRRGILAPGSRAQPATSVITRRLRRVAKMRRNTHDRKLALTHNKAPNCRPALSKVLGKDKLPLPVRAFYLFTVKVIRVALWLTQSTFVCFHFFQFLLRATANTAWTYSAPTPFYP